MTSDVQNFPTTHNFKDRRYKYWKKAEDTSIERTWSSLAQSFRYCVVWKIKLKNPPSTLYLLCTWWDKIHVLWMSFFQIDQLS